MNDKEKAIDLLEGILKGTDKSDLYDAMRMALDALKAQTLRRDSEEDFCEACRVHYSNEE